MRVAAVPTPGWSEGLAGSQLRCLSASPGFATGQLSQTASSRTDVRDCSAEPPVSLPEPPTLLLAHLAWGHRPAPPLWLVPANPRPSVPPVPAPYGHQHHGTAGRSACLHANPPRRCLHRAFHGCPHGKAAACPWSQGAAPPAGAAGRLSGLCPHCRASTSRSGTRGWAGSAASAALQVGPSPPPWGPCRGGQHLGATAPCPRGFSGQGMGMVLLHTGRAGDSRGRGLELEDF